MTKLTALTAPFGDLELVARIKRGFYVPWGAGTKARLAARTIWQRLALRALPPHCGFCGADQPPLDVPDGGYVEVTCPRCGKRYRVEPTYFAPPGAGHAI